MTRKWPSFVTADLGDTVEDADEMIRRWEIYNREMQAIIAKGGVHQDDDGWWFDDATGDMIGPDPEIERPLTEEEMKKARPLREVSPDLYASIQRSRGRPPVDHPKQAVTIRLDPRTLAKFKATGADWRARIVDVLDKAKP